MIYLLIAIALLILSYNYDYKKKQWSANVFALVLIAFVCLAGLRYRIGLDTIRYESHFEYAPSLSTMAWSDIFEGEFAPLYMLLQALTKEISDNFYLLQFVQAFIVNLSVFRFLKRNTKAVYFSLFLYFLLIYHNFCFEVMREALAVSMFLFSWESYKTGKWIKYLFFVILALGFHPSAIVLLLLPVVKIFNLNKYLSMSPRLFIIAPVVVLLGFIIQRTFFDYFLLLDLQDSISERISNYSTSDYGRQTLNYLGIITTVLFRVLFPYYVINHMRTGLYSSKGLLEVMVVLFACFSLLSIPITIFYRLVNYMYLFAVVLYADFFNELHNHSFSSRFSFFIPLILITLWAFTGKEGHARVYNRYLPYSSIITKDTDAKRESLYNDYI